MTKTSLVLPFPPSINRLWRSGKGRTYRSRDYTKWLYEAGNKLSEQNPTKTDGSYRLCVRLYPPDKRRRDLDNYAFKSVSDVLVHHNVLAEDCHCRELHAWWCDIDKANPRAEVEITEL